MKDHEITCDWIDRYNENELNDTEKALFQKRLLVNPLLRSEVNIDASLNRLLNDGDLLDLMNKVNAAAQKSRVGSPLVNFMMIAASLLFLAMIGGLFYLFRANTGTPAVSLMPQQLRLQRNPGSSSGTSAGEPCSLFSEHKGTMIPGMNVHRMLMAENYKPMAELELLAGTVTRSHHVRLTSPQSGISVPKGCEILFSWQYSGRIVPLSIFIMNNRGKQISEKMVLNDNSYCLKTSVLAEGLYYWKIMVQENMVLMGKFTIY